MKDTTDYGRPMKPFFIEIQNFWAWADKFYPESNYDSKADELSQGP